MLGCRNRTFQALHYPALPHPCYPHLYLCTSSTLRSKLTKLFSIPGLSHSSIQRHKGPADPTPWPVQPGLCCQENQTEEDRTLKPLSIARTTALASSRNGLQDMVDPKWLLTVAWASLAALGSRALEIPDPRGLKRALQGVLARGRRRLGLRYSLKLPDLANKIVCLMQYLGYTWAKKKMIYLSEVQI